MTHDHPAKQRHQWKCQICKMCHGLEIRRIFLFCHPGTLRLLTLVRLVSALRDIGWQVICAFDWVRVCVLGALVIIMINSKEGVVLIQLSKIWGEGGKSHHHVAKLLIQLSLFRPYRVTAGTSGSEKMRSVNSSLYNQRFWSVIWFLSIPKIFWIFKDIHNIKDILVIWFLITQTTLWSTLPSSAIATVTKYWLNWTRRSSNYR